ncbi:hypothetical protein FQZ97_902530 [compost metagenome]
MCWCWAVARRALRLDLVEALRDRLAVDVLERLLEPCLEGRGHVAFNLGLAAVLQRSVALVPVGHVAEGDALGGLLLGNGARVDAHAHAAQMFAGDLAGLIDGEDPVRPDADAGRTAVDAPLHDVGDLAGGCDPQAEALNVAVPMERLFVSGRGDLVDVVLRQLRHGVPR